MLPSSFCLSWNKVSELPSGEVPILVFREKSLGGLHHGCALPLCLSGMGSSLRSSALEPGDVPGRRICKSMRSSPHPMTGVPRSFSAVFSNSYAQPSAIHQNCHLSVPTNLWLCHREANLGVISFWTHLIPQILGWPFALQPHFSDGFKTSH